MPAAWCCATTCLSGAAGAAIPRPPRLATARASCALSSFFAAGNPSAWLPVGHSYGGRQTAMAAAEHPQLAETLLLLSYPLHPPKRPDQKRTAYFADLRTPTLFVHGTKDPFATIEELREEIAAIPSRTDVLVVEGAGTRPETRRRPFVRDAHAAACPALLF